MNRQILLQKIVDKLKVKNYLEIGTFQGASFLPLKCRKKVAVDPKFKISKKKKIRWLLKNPYNISNTYFEMTSDSFFLNKEAYLKKTGSFDLIFIDGLHTFNASLKDVLNSFKYLSNDGYVVMHDCFPPHAAAATPAGSALEARKIYGDDWPGDWCGDVWKTIVYLKQSFKDKLEVSVVDADFGLGVLKFKCDNYNLEFDQSLFDKIDALDYSDLIRNPESLINLKDTCLVDQLII